MKRMLINATQAEELRVAIADGQKLIDLDLETPAHEQKKANVYKARITRVEHSLEACFVNYGSERHGFLPFKEINPAALSLPDGVNPNNVNLKEVLKEGQELIVQVEKEERGTKGAALSSYISLAGRYSVLMPNSPKSGGVSRRISGEERDQIRTIMDQLNIPKNMGLIIRTAGVGREIEELQWDLDYLQQLWSAIEKAAGERKAPFLIYQESNLIIRALRDYLRDDINEILIDNDSVYQNALEFMQLVMPHNLRKLKIYQSETPMFTRYQIESQIETAFAREVTLPSGGSLVIDHTEALLSIDINSARATKGSDIEETAYHTNLEAADEIARQLRIRDLGGLIVIDFIDMLNRGNQRRVEERIRDALSQDRARIQTGRISKFGLLEMSRQRMRPSIGESSYQTCPRCIGHGSIRSVESLALSILRLIEEEAIKDYTGQILAQAPTKVANFLHNEKREAIQIIEQRHNVPILVLANPDMHTPRFEIKRLRKAEISDEPSYLQINLDEGEVVASDVIKATAAAEQPAVSNLRPSDPAPQARPTKQGWWQAIIAFFTNREDAADSTARRKKKQAQKSAKQARQQQRKGPQQTRGNDRQQNPADRRAKKTGKRTTSRKKTGKKTAKKAAVKQPTQNTSGKDAGGNNNVSDEQKNNPPRRRGKRGGRKRRGRQQQPGDAIQANSQSNNQANNQANQQGNQQGNTHPNQPPGKQPPSNDNASGAQRAAAAESQPKQARQPQDRPPANADQQQPSNRQDGQRAQPKAEPSKAAHPTGDNNNAGSQANGAKSVATPAPVRTADAARPTSEQPARPEQATRHAADQGRESSSKSVAKETDTSKPRVDTKTTASTAAEASKPSRSKPDSAAAKQPRKQSATDKPATASTPTGPSAKPEAVKGLYSLAEPANKPQRESSDKPPERSGTDG